MSILRPEKRDPNYIRNKSDIGLSKVDNISSAEFANIVLDQVKRHINRETIYQTSGLQKIALAKITSKDDSSGNLLKILSGNIFLVFAALNEREEIIEAAKLEVIYTHYEKEKTNKDDDDSKIEYNLFIADTDNVSDEFSYLKNSSIEFRERIFEDENKNRVAELYVVLCSSKPIPFVSSNLFEYSNGGTVLDPTVTGEVLFSDDNTKLIKSIQCNHNKYSLVDRSESTLGFEIYDENGDPVRVNEKSENISPDLDIPKINGIPFTGRKDVFVNGKNSRQITVSAKHEGPSLSEAGKHDWEVLTFSPRPKYTYKDSEGVITDFADIRTGEKEADYFLDKSQFKADGVGYGYGLCRLSKFDSSLPNKMFDGELTVNDKLRELYKWTESLSPVDSDVITVRAMKTFADSITALLFQLHKEGSDASLGYHYLFDYMDTSHAVTRVTYDGYYDNPNKDADKVSERLCEIKMGVFGASNGSTIDVVDTSEFIFGGDPGWVSIKDFSHTPNESAQIVFSFLPNKTNDERYAYYVVPSTVPGMSLLFRFYQGIETSNLRVKIVTNGVAEYYGLGAHVKKSIPQEGGKYTFDYICIVDTELLDPNGDPSITERVLGYAIDNRYEDGGINISLTRKEENNKILGFEATLPVNETYDERNPKISVTQDGINILTLELIQKPKQAEFNGVPETVTVKGYSGETQDFTFTSTRSWIMSVIRGKGDLTISPTSGVVTDGDSQEFTITVTANKNNTNTATVELGALKLVDVDESVTEKITIHQSPAPAEINLNGGNDTIYIPYNEGGVKVFDDFYSTYDWEAVLDGSAAEYVSINPEKGERTSTDGIEYTPLTLTTLKTTTSTSDENRGRLTITYGNKESYFNIVQEKAGLSLETTKSRVSLGYAAESSDSTTVTSNYGWNIKLVHSNESSKKFKAFVDNDENKTEGVNGSSITFVALAASDKEEEVYLGSVEIYMLGELQKTIEVYQSKVDMSISIDAEDGEDKFYADGIVIGTSSTVATVPVVFFPTTAEVNATYSVDGSPIQTATVKDSQTAGTKLIEFGNIGSNSKGSTKRSVKVTAQVTSGGITKDVTMTFYQRGFSNGVKITKNGDTKTYYGGSITDDSIYFAPIKGDTITSTTLYETIGSDLSSVVNNISYPSTWLEVSKETDVKSENYFLKKKYTIEENSTGTNRSSNIKFTVGSEHDSTSVIIPVIQYTGEWTFSFGDGEDLEKYTESSPYSLEFNDPDPGASVMLPTILSRCEYTKSDGSKAYKNLDIDCTRVDDVENIGKWSCGYAFSENGECSVKFVTNSALGSSDKSTTYCITQVSTQKKFYVKVTQRIGPKITVRGGNVNKDLVFVKMKTDVSALTISLTSQELLEVKNNATTFKGASWNTVTTISNKNINTINAVNAEDGKTYSGVSQINFDVDRIANNGAGYRIYVYRIESDGLYHHSDTAAIINENTASDASLSIDAKSILNSNINIIDYTRESGKSYQYILTTSLDSDETNWKDIGSSEQNAHYKCHVIVHYNSSASQQVFFQWNENGFSFYEKGKSLPLIDQKIDSGTTFYVYRREIIGDPGFPTNSSGNPWSIWGYNVGTFTWNDSDTENYEITIE